MLQLILHGLGDFIIQTGWMALNKKKPGFKGFLACLVHCVTYAAPFLLICSWQATAAIFASHFIIDRTNIVSYLIAMRDGVFKKSVPPDKMNYQFPYMYDVSNFGFPNDRPLAISIWLNIIFDNFLHIVCNYFSILYL